MKVEAELMFAAANLLSSIDYVVVLIYLAITIAIGLQIGRRVKTGQDFFLGGRRLPWWAIGMSLVATDIGGTDVIVLEVPRTNMALQWPTLNGSAVSRR
jgi:Na+/pantothenate symporter